MTRSDVKHDKSILCSRLNRTEFVSTLSGIAAPDPTSYTIAECNITLVAIGKRQSLLSKLDAKSLALITDQDGLRYQPVQLPEYLLEQVNAGEFQPIFSVDDDGNPVALPSSVNTTEAVFCWHPALFTMAVVLQNGTLCLYDVGRTSWLPLSLQSDHQARALHVRYCPTHPNIIAVLCPSHVCLWQLSPGQTTASLQFLRPSNWTASPPDESVGSLSFSPSGRYLAFVCQHQPSVAVWDLSSSPNSQYVSLKQRLKSLAVVEFSPNGRYLIALSMSSSHYLLWDTVNWECIRWSTGGSPGSSLVWHRDHDLFLLSHLSSSVIHSIRVCPVECSMDFDAYPDEMGSQHCYGGNIRAMAWSPDCQRLALSFTNELDSPAAISSDLIALLATNVKKDERIKFCPIGFIRGPPSRIPHALNPPERFEFRPYYDHGALLAVLWSQGQITFYPLLYKV